MRQAHLSGSDTIAARIVRRERKRDDEMQLWRHSGEGVNHAVAVELNE